MNIIILVAIGILLAVYMQGQAFGQISIDRLNKYSDVYFEKHGIIMNLNPIEMKCINYDNHESCIRLEESQNRHLKMLMANTEADKLEITSDLK
jgi:hypothetical protein